MQRGSASKGAGGLQTRGLGRPPPSDTTGCGHRAGGTYPTGMHSCDATKTTRCIRALFVRELVVSETQCSYKIRV